MRVIVPCVGRERPKAHRLVREADLASDSRRRRQQQTRLNPSNTPHKSQQYDMLITSQLAILHLVLDLIPAS